MTAVRNSRLKRMLLAALFAASIGFGAAQADGPYAEGCSPRAGCLFGGDRHGCCVDDS
ncbi:hypothetical protein [Lysobacter antibioticus]|uniref:hypothetical protein n=1 Tax=Lysobacter antibioticus TaxID=84531 RepID=UPI00164663FB|nr:hypothetical protein [Lysobacter antibioticus]